MPTPPSERRTELEDTLARLREELAAAGGTAREPLQQQIDRVEQELRDIVLDQYNQSSMDGGSEAIRPVEPDEK